MIKLLVYEMYDIKIISLETLIKYESNCMICVTHMSYTWSMLKNLTRDKSNIQSK